MTSRRRVDLSPVLDSASRTAARRRGVLLGRAGEAHQPSPAANQRLIHEPLVQRFSENHYARDRSISTCRSAQVLVTGRPSEVV